MAKIDFYFDFISPYSYIAFKVLQQLRNPWKLHINFRPARLPHLIKESGNSPPAQAPSRRAFLGRDLHRTASFYALPYNPPENFFSASMMTAGMVVVAAQTVLGEDSLLIEKLIDGFWDRFFAKGDKSYFTGSLEDLTPLVKEILEDELQTGKIMETVASPENEQKYWTNTTNALQLGAFGVPTMVITRETDGASEFFFGSDRFHHIAHFLGTDPTLAYQKNLLSSKL